MTTVKVVFNNDGKHLTVTFSYHDGWGKCPKQRIWSLSNDRGLADFIHPECLKDILDCLLKLNNRTYTVVYGKVIRTEEVTYA